MIADQSGISVEEIQGVIDSIMKRAVGRARRDQAKDIGSSTLELMVIQYVIKALDELLDDVDIEDIREARKLLGMPERKLMN